MLNNLFPFKPCNTVYGALLAFRINETDGEVTSVFFLYFSPLKGAITLRDPILISFLTLLLPLTSTKISVNLLFSIILDPGKVRYQQNFTLQCKVKSKIVGYFVSSEQMMGYFRFGWVSKGLMIVRQG